MLNSLVNTYLQVTDVCLFKLSEFNCSFTLMLLYLAAKYCIPMKKLLVIRHAKSSWDLTALTDFDRQLNERGHNDAPMMAKRLLDKQIAIDAFVSSTATRALTTATYFAATYQQGENRILQFDELYNASANTILKVVSHLSKTIETAALFAHNPGVTDFANTLTTTQIDSMPTCGIFAVKAQCDAWEDFKKAKKEFWFFDYPKNL